MIRIATSADCAGVIALVDAVYREYDEKLCLEQADNDLCDLQASYFAKGGCFWVLEINKSVLGTHGAFPDPQLEGVCRFRRLYLDRHLRGTHWGHDLMQITIDWARQRGFREVQFWSDTRFHRAHRFFEKFGFVRDGRIREMLDGHEPYREYFFSLNL